VCEGFTAASLECEWHATALGVAFLTLVARLVTAPLLSRALGRRHASKASAPLGGDAAGSVCSGAQAVSRGEQGVGWRRGSASRRTSGTAKRPPWRPDGRRARGPTAARSRAWSRNRPFAAPAGATDPRLDGRRRHDAAISRAEASEIL